MTLSTARAAEVKWFQIGLAGGPWWAARPLLFLSLALAAVLTRPNLNAGSWIWVVALFILGMPHGAYDLAAMQRLTGSRARTGLLFGVYSLVMAACVVLFLAAPVWSLIAFFLLSAHHFGISDSVWTRGAIVRSIAGHGAGLGRGLCIIFAPFVLMPLESWEPFAAIAQFVNDAPAARSDLIDAAAAIALCVGLTLVLFTAFRQRHQRALVLEELLTIGAYLVMASVAPPLVAIGAYFMLVHASGHCGRARGIGNPLPDASLPRRLANAVRVHRDSVWLLLPSIAFVLGVAWHLGGLSIRPVALSFLLFCVVATLPHHLLWMGWRFGLRVPRAA
jgi:Brp/Blh family beta-carotene 15,15'-monooxygenase